MLIWQRTVAFPAKTGESFVSATSSQYSLFFLFPSIFLKIVFIESYFPC
jgi:hypothetical protein